MYTGLSCQQYHLSSCQSSCFVHLRPTKSPRWTKVSVLLYPWAGMVGSWQWSAMSERAALYCCGGGGTAAGLPLTMTSRWLMSFIHTRSPRDTLMKIYVGSNLCLSFARTSSIARIIDGATVNYVKHEICRFTKAVVRNKGVLLRTKHSYRAPSPCAVWFSSVIDFWFLTNTEQFWFSFIIVMYKNNVLTVNLWV